MDKDAAELVARLCTLAGTIMEDVSPIALTRSEDTAAVIAEVRQAGNDILALADAAEAAARRG
ncbi:hypothetical protein [Pseudorhodoplanes sp.]|uniref:hypothetical protein n=1 Tax=Pseudorhodoplanes sp. TaxID=1934341 RepID=UPI003D12056A